MEPAALFCPCRRSMSWILDRENFERQISGRALPHHGIADGGAVERLGERRDPADPAVLGIGFVLADDAELALLIVVVDRLDNGTEADPIGRLAVGINEDVPLDPLLEIADVALHQL